MLEDELKKATKILGIYRDNLLVNRYRVRHFDRYRQEILENLVELQKGIKWFTSRSPYCCTEGNESIKKNDNFGIWNATE